jgi:hypothetical protein
MKIALIALGTAAAVAVTAAAPAEAHRTGPVTCADRHHGHCLAWRSRYNVGYVFGPSYGYTAYSALPPAVVTRYHLRNRDRYVYENGSVYVVNPRTYRVTRVIRGG